MGRPVTWMRASDLQPAARRCDAAPGLRPGRRAHFHRASPHYSPSGLTSLTRGYGRHARLAGLSRLIGLAWLAVGGPVLLAPEQSTGEYRRMGFLNMQRRRIQRAATVGIATVAMASFVAACSSSGGGGSASGSSSSSAALSGTLNASGSTFQLTFQQAAIQAFKSVQSGMTVNYGGGGSGKGRTDLASGTVQFAGSDSPIPSDEASSFAGKPTVLYFPVIVGPITVSYNLSGVTKPLQLTPTVIANIFQGKIKKWNDPAIASLNSGVKLPSTAITIARRSDSSGTTANFSLFLEDSTKAWKLGSSSTINWPASSRGGDGNGGVAQIVKSTPGAVGYVDYADAKASGLSFASVQNASGKYIAPSTTAASAAAAGAKVASNLTFAAVWSGDATAYPITYQSWDLVFAKQKSANDVKMLKAYLGYLLGPGQQLLPSLSYAPLPANIDQQAKAQLSKITS
ncbi:MAG TPA: phosphate ABC transporter substrate-binding protein PstS [Streptosporangiaceae bacterium]|nr:phosphate ABC transporter substrate-binding protein PstS [Streptosporangiaceae bacterium]